MQFAILHRRKLKKQDSGHWIFHMDDESYVVQLVDVFRAKIRILIQWRALGQIQVTMIEPGQVCLNP